MALTKVKNSNIDDADLVTLADNGVGTGANQIVQRDGSGDIPGVVKSDWTQKTQMLSVTYKTKKVKSIDIHKAVAKVGHDTDIERANDKVYDALHGCCHYTRPEKKK